MTAFNVQPMPIRAVNRPDAPFADLERLRDAGDVDELLSVLERVVALGPPTLELAPLLADVARELELAYVARLGAGRNPLGLAPQVPVPDALADRPRIAAIVPLLVGYPLDAILHNSPLSTLETLALLSLLDRAGVLVCGVHAPVRPPPLPTIPTIAVPPPDDPAKQAKRVAQRQQDLARALRVRQVEARFEPNGTDPWASCTYLRAEPAPQGALRDAAIAVLVDTLGSPGCLRVRTGSWNGAGVTAEPFEARVWHAPATTIELTLELYGGRVRRWKVPCAAHHVTFVCLTPRWFGWRCHQTVRRFADPPGDFSPRRS
jgi:hypothetical protein